MYCCNCGNKVDSNFCSSCGTKVGNNSSKKVTQTNSIKFKSKFKKVYREIDMIESKIHRKEGFFFTNHIYNQDELLNSAHHNRINSITGKIGDDVKNWHMTGKLSEEERFAYYEERDNTDDMLHRLHLEIENREPTWWENIKGVANSFIILIMDNLPALSGWLLENTAKVMLVLPAPVGKIMGPFILKINDIYSDHKRKRKQLEQK